LLRGREKSGEKAITMLRFEFRTEHLPNTNYNSNAKFDSNSSPFIQSFHVEEFRNKERKLMLKNIF